MKCDINKPQMAKLDANTSFLNLRMMVSCDDCGRLYDESLEVTSLCFGDEKKNTISKKTGSCCRGK